MTTILILLVAGIACLVLYKAGREAAETELQEEAIKRGCAEYNAKTGEWQWKDESVSK